MTRHANGGDARGGAPFSFTDTADLAVVAWLAQYDPLDLPPSLGDAFRLGPIQSSLGITQPIVWLANLSCDFQKAYASVDDPDNAYQHTLGGRWNRDDGVRTYPREFDKEEQGRFDRLQDEYHNLRWRNLLNLGYDPATAATMVGAVKDAERNMFSPPPLFALSPRMIVTDEDKRQSMRRVLIDYLDGKAQEAERELLEDLEREGSLLLGGGGDNPAAAKKAGKNARKKAKKKKKLQERKQQQQQRQQQQQQKQQQQPKRQQQPSQAQTQGEQSQQREPPEPAPHTFQEAHQKASEQSPLNDEQLKYLRDHQQRREGHEDPTGPSYSASDRKIIEEALQRTGLSPSAVVPTDAAERVYRESCRPSPTPTPGGGTDDGGGRRGGEDDGSGEGPAGRDGGGDDGGGKPKDDGGGAREGHEGEEARSYAYAWCCDYCKTATFPTFAEAALHEAKCPSFLEQRARKEKEEEAEEKEGGAGKEEKAHSGETKDADKKDNEEKSTSPDFEAMNDEALFNNIHSTKPERTTEEMMPIVHAINLEWKEVGEKKGCTTSEEEEVNSDGEMISEGNGFDESKIDNRQQAREQRQSDPNRVAKKGAVSKAANHKRDVTIKGKKRPGKKEAVPDELCQVTKEKAIAGFSREHTAHSNTSENGQIDRSVPHDERQHCAIATAKTNPKKSHEPSTNGKKKSLHDTAKPSSPSFAPSTSSEHKNVKLNELATKNEGWKPVVSAKNKDPPSEPMKNKTSNNRQAGTNAKATSPIRERSSTFSKARIKKDDSPDPQNEISHPKRTKNKQKKGTTMKNQRLGQSSDSLDIIKLANGNHHQKENMSTCSNERKEQCNASLSFSTKNPAPDSASLSERDLVKMMKPLVIDYDDRVNDAALLPPPSLPTSLSQTSSILPPLVQDDTPEGPATQSPSTLPQNLPAAITVEATASGFAVSSLTSKIEVLTARNNFLSAENKSLIAENEALRNQSIEAVQRVQLKSYIAETARDAAEERVSQLEKKLADALAQMAALGAARRLVPPVAYHSYPPSMQGQVQDNARRLMSPPQAVPPSFHFQPQPAPSPVALPVSNMMVSPSVQNDLLGRPQLPKSTPYNHPNDSQGNNNGLFLNAAPQQDSNNDFWEPPWMMRNENPLGASRESVLSRLRRGDHA